jgi:hypothetical protein
MNFALAVRGRRECRMHGAPAASRAKVESTRVSHHRCAASRRHSPRDGFNGFLRALPGDRALLSPLSARRGTRLHQLNASVGASEPHDFAVRIGVLRLCTPMRPSHPAPNVRDDREAPLLRVRDGVAHRTDFTVERSEIFLPKRLDTSGQEQPDRQIIGPGRRL